MLLSEVRPSIHQPAARMVPFLPHVPSYSIATIMYARDRPARRQERFGGMLSSYYHKPTQAHLLDFSHHTS
ncbi:MAG: hypothetical protein OEZ05_02130 [Nitrospirota bacterium]|nr:hypothetical protein [Nitrospirota bacterium]